MSLPYMALYEQVQELYDTSLQMKYEWIEKYAGNANFHYLQSQEDFEKICGVDHRLRDLLSKLNFVCVVVNSGSDESKQHNWYELYGDIINKELFILSTNNTSNKAIVEFWFKSSDIALQFKLKYYMCLVYEY